MSVNVKAEDLSAATAGTTGTVSWAGLVQTGSPVGVRAGRPVLRLFNESGCGLAYTVGVSSGRLPAGGWVDMQLNGENELSYTVEYVLPGQPVSLLLGTIYEPGEPIPPLPQLGNSPIGIGGTVSTSTGNSLQNDGNAPGTQIIEATPSDQAASALALNNDGSGLWKVLSAGVLRILLAITRGNATTGKAAVQLGDNGDPSILTMYGTLGAGSVVPASTVSGTVASAASVPASGVQPGTFPTGEFDIKSPDAVGAIALALWSGNVSGGFGHAMELKNGSDNTCAATIGIGDFTQSPFGFGTWLYDLKTNAAVFTGVSAERTVAKRGPLAQMTTNGGGNAGNRLWEGTTDPGANAGEGDWWAPA